MPRHSGGYEPERRAKPVQRPKAKKRSGIRGLFWGLYKLAVVLSALIVFGYVGLSVALRPPEIPSQTTGQGQTGQTVPVVDSSREDSQTRVRRDGVYNFVLLGKDVDSGNTDTIIVVR